MGFRIFGQCFAICRNMQRVPNRDSFSKAYQDWKNPICIVRRLWSVPVRLGCLKPFISVITLAKIGYSCRQFKSFFNAKLMDFKK